MILKLLAVIPTIGSTLAVCWKSLDGELEEAVWRPGSFRDVTFARAWDFSVFTEDNNTYFTGYLKNKNKSDNQEVLYLLVMQVNICWWNQMRNSFSIIPGEGLPWWSRG